MCGGAVGDDDDLTEAAARDYPNVQAAASVEGEKAKQCYHEDGVSCDERDVVMAALLN